MVENLLSEALRNLISDAVKDFRLPSKEGDIKAPKIVDGFLPLKRGNNDDDFPFVLVRIEGGKTEQESTNVEVSVIVGCYAETFDGHAYCLNVMSRIRNALMNLPGWILDNKYVLSFPIEYNVIPDQPYPYWQLDITTHWEVKTPPVVF
jgi:hypothetical protein